MNNYGQLPVNLGYFPIKCEESLYFLYLPISLAGSAEVTMPRNLWRFAPLIEAIRKDLGERFIDEIVYVTAKHMYCAPGTTANRPGYHSDGFLTNDLNYVWYDSLPTVFNNSAFWVALDHEKSLEQFETQVQPENDVTYGCMQLLKLDQQVIHRVAEATVPMFRTFVKISVSEHEYNLSSNSHNYDLAYSWPMHERQAVRNSPHTSQRDSMPAMV